MIVRRDRAGHTVLCAARGRSGTVPEVLGGIADAVGAPGLELVAQPAAALEAAGITPSSGLLG